eukprot:571285_1
MIFHIFWLIILQWVHSANIWSDDMAVKSPDWSVDLGTYDIWSSFSPKNAPCYAFVLSDPVTLSRTAQTTGYSNVQLIYSYSSSGVKGNKECVIDYSLDGVNYVTIQTIDTDVGRGAAVDQTYFGWGSNADNLSGYGVTIRIRSTGGCQCFFDDFSLTGTTARPTAAPTKTPSAYPTLPPSIPTTTPSKQPTLTPTTQPSKQPTIPSLSPTPDAYGASIWNDAFNGYSGWSHPPGTNTFYGNALLYSGRCPNTNSCVMFWTEGYYLWKSVSSVYTYSRLRFQLDIGTEGSVSCSASYKFDSGNWIEGIRVTNSGSEETDYQNFYAQTMYIEGDGTESTLTIKIASHHDYRQCYFDNAILKGIIRTAPPTLPSAAPTLQPTPTHPYPVPIWEDTFTDSWDSWSLDYVVESCTWSTEITSEQAHCPNPGDEPCGEVVTHCYGQPVWIKKTADVSLLALLRLEFGVGAETYQTEAKCEVWYKFDTSSAWVMTNTTYGDHTKRTYYKPVVMYPHEMVFLDVPNGANTVTFKLQSNTRQSHPTQYSSTTSCYWDNVILRGKVRSTTPTSETLLPTKRPSSSPTKRPTESPNIISTSPTKHPTYNPNTAATPTSETSSPTKRPSSSPNTIPTLPTNQPTSPTTFAPTNDPTAATTSAPTITTTKSPSVDSPDGASIFFMGIIGNYRDNDDMSLIVMTQSDDYIDVELKQWLETPLDDASTGSIALLSESSSCYHSSLCTKFWQFDYSADTTCPTLTLEGDWKGQLSVGCFGQYHEKQQCLEAMEANDVTDVSVFSGTVSNFMFEDAICDDTLYGKLFASDVVYYKNAQFSDQRNDNKRYKKGDTVYAEIMVDDEDNAFVINNVEISNVFMCINDEEDPTLDDVAQIKGIGGCTLLSPWIVIADGVGETEDDRNRFSFKIPDDIDADQLFIQIQTSLSLQSVTDRRRNLLQNVESTEIRHFMTNIVLNGASGTRSGSGKAFDAMVAMVGGDTSVFVGIVAGIGLCLLCSLCVGIYCCTKRKRRAIVQIGAEDVDDGDETEMAVTSDGDNEMKLTKGGSLLALPQATTAGNIMLDDGIDDEY